MKTVRFAALTLLFAALCLGFVSIPSISRAQNAEAPFDIKANYTKAEYRIRMRDGVQLFTSVYLPKDASQRYPIMLSRTPYSVSPYGADAYKTALGPSPLFAREGFIFVYQDARGRYMSEGDFKWMTPYKPKKSGPTDVDESTDTWDTIEWLVNNIPNNNGRVGMWGISFPGFYTAAAIVDAHPALKAASPQAPMSDNYLGDDMHHNGAFFLAHAFLFISGFGRQPAVPTMVNTPRMNIGTPDAYRFFLDMGPLKNANEKYFKGEIRIWNEWMEHGDYDQYWQAQNVPQHLNNVRPAVLTVGGWFDAEDLPGPLSVYRAIERNNPRAENRLVMGPWCHGCWARSDGDQLGDIDFGSKTGLYFRERIEFPFFNYYLKDKGEMKLPEASVFASGANEWRQYETWPPKGAQSASLYLREGGALAWEAANNSSEGSSDKSSSVFDEYTSDPARPVPFIGGVAPGMTRDYMVEDQRFAARRPDVLVYQTGVLDRDVTMAGPLTADLFVSTTGTDSDFIIKLIDVLPDDAPDPSPNPKGVRMGGFQMLVRGEPFRSRYRNSFSRPEPMKPGEATRLKFGLPDVLHTFRKGHRIMVQVQSTWFPLVDRNPQTFVNIFKAGEEDFQKATQRVYRAGAHSSRLEVSVLR